VEVDILVYWCFANTKEDAGSRQGQICTKRRESALCGVSLLPQTMAVRGDFGAGANGMSSVP
jgi:hypothetical protein